MICMRQLIKIFSWIALLAVSLQSARAYSLGGPIGNGGDAWQVPVIGYGLPGDLLAPKNLGEEYRRNVPVLYYAYNANFLDYFGSNGPVAIDAAFAILNSLTNVDSYSSMLSEFPLETRQTKFEAQTLGLFDLKSMTLGMMMEQMGLATPERYTWTLHDRFLEPATTCPAGEEYLVVMRNFDFTSSPLNQLQYSPYINDTLYTYNILEACTGPNPLAVTVPIAVDPLADTFTPVASLDIGYGDFYSGLTRDDVAGLRYLLSTNNLNTELVGTGGLLLTTNIGTQAQETLITTLDLSALLASASTNAPAALQALFPNVVVTSSTFTFSAVCTPNVIAYFTNQVGAPFGSPPVSVIVTNGTICVPQTNFFDVFANVITNGNLAGNPNIINPGGYTLNYSPNTAATVVTTTLGAQTGAPFGSPPVTNTTVQTVTQAGTASGEYFIIPAGQCGWQIVSPQPPGFPIAGQPVFTTNVIASATNTAGFVTSQSIVTSFTPHTYVVEPITCLSTPGTVGLRQGIGKVQFVRADFDSLLGQFFQPITNNYTMVAVTNSQPVTQFFQRVVTAPDFTFSAADLASGPAAIPAVFTLSRNVNFDQTQILPGLAGPGVINTPTTITFDKVGPVFFNTPLDVGHPGLDGTPFFTEFPGSDTTDLFYAFYFVWASFDGSTNEPVVYPDGTSIANLENQVLVQISVTPANGVNLAATPMALANGANGTPYGPVTFSATDSSVPLTWSATGLPAGMTMTTAGILSGTPTQSGTFDFTVQLTDSINRSVQWNFSITIP